MQQQQLGGGLQLGGALGGGQQMSQAPGLRLGTGIGLGQPPGGMGILLLFPRESESRYP